MNNNPHDVETLRLVTAFFKIADPEARRIIVAIAEATANGKTISAEILRSLASAERQG